jgi:peptidoglycan hydrolase-like protein with peptidoglycan-binding domain
MSELIAVEEEFSMSRLLDALRRSISFYYTNWKMHLTPRLSLPESRLQTEGATGDDIAAFQKRFNLFADRYGITAPVNGVYDEDTRRAVIEFQSTAMYVLDTDGFIGPDTARVLRIKLRRG